MWCGYNIFLKNSTLLLQPFCLWFTVTLLKLLPSSHLSGIFVLLVRLIYSVKRFYILSRICKPPPLCTPGKFWFCYCFLYTFLQNSLDTLPKPEPPTWQELEFRLQLWNPFLINVASLILYTFFTFSPPSISP